MIFLFLQRTEVEAFKNNANQVPEKPVVPTQTRKKSIDDKKELALNDLPYFLKDGNREIVFKILKEIKQVRSILRPALKEFQSLTEIGIRFL